MAAETSTNSAAGNARRKFSRALLVVLREGPAMGVLLGLHLGVLGALYVTLPYSKFAHVVYRYAAIIKHRVEGRRDEAATS